ncbi:MAG TPA: hypothetical protein VMG58_04010 [Candidatus Sulfotelmatobacter sp.]|nr:hypothetical protein [Candidatus Sulfotelmatobacter sp.]
MSRLRQLFRDWWAPYAPDSLGDNYLKISRAILRRRPVSARLGQEVMIFCPHALGFRRAEPYVLALAMPATRAGGTQRDTGPAWRWIAVAGLCDIKMHGGHWSTAPPMPVFEDFEIAVKVA